MSTARVRVPGEALLADASYGMFAWLLPLGAALITAPIVVAALGPSGYAIYALAVAYGASAAAFAPGRGLIHLLSSEASSDERASVLGTGLAAALVAGGSAAIVFSLAAPGLADAVASLDGSSTSWALRLAALSAVPAAVVAIALASLQGIGRVDLMARLTAAFALVTVTGVAFLAWSGVGPVGIMAGQLSIGLILAMTSVGFVRLVAGGPRWRVSWPIVRRLARFSAAALTAQVASAAWLVSERAIIGHLLGPSSLTAYVVALMLGAHLQGVLVSGTQVLASSIRAASSHEATSKAYFSASKLVALLAVAGAAGVAGAGGPFLELWMGSSLAEITRPVLVPIAIAFGVNGLSTVAWFVNEADGHPARNAVLSVCWAIVGTAVLWGLAPRWGLFGAAMARVIAQGLTPLAIAWTERQSSVRLHGPWRMLAFWVVPAGVMLAWGLDASLSFFSPSWLSLVATCAVGLTLYAVVLWWSPVLSERERAIMRHSLSGIRP